MPIEYSDCAVADSGYLDLQHALSGAAIEGRIPQLRFYSSLANKEMCTAALGNASLARGIKRQVVEILLSAGAAPNAETVYGRSILSQICEGEKGDIDSIVGLLLSKGADPNFVGSEQWKNFTALSRCARGGHLKSVRNLLRKGADPQSGHSPLVEALAGGHEQVAKVLIEHGADVNAKGSAGATPMSLARSRNLPIIVELLKAKGAK